MAKIKTNLPPDAAFKNVPLGTTIYCYGKTQKTKYNGQVAYIRYLDRNELFDQNTFYRKGFGKHWQPLPIAIPFGKTPNDYPYEQFAQFIKAPNVIKT